MVERNIRVKEPIVCDACGAKQTPIVYVDGRVDVACSGCGRSGMIALPGSLAHVLSSGRG